jgi:hypothetical protein
LGLVASSFVQIFWLDQPRVDAQTRTALSRAFNDATAYGERIQQVSNKKPAIKRRSGTHFDPTLRPRNVMKRRGVQA